MNADIELLNDIYQNSQVGRNTLKHFLKINGDNEFHSVLDSQFQEYNTILDMAEQKKKELSNYGARGICARKKVSTRLALHAGTLTDKSPSHMSEMLIEGNMLGVIDITKKLKMYKDAEGDILSLGERLLAFEQQNIEACKRFL